MLNGPTVRLGHLTLTWLAWLAMGAVIGGTAWGIGRTPLVAVLIPFLAYVSRLRTGVFFLTLGYHLAVVRFLPDYGTNWFGSELYGLAIWLSLGLVCAAAWVVFWTASRRPVFVAISCASSFIVTLMPPIALVMPGHPLVAWGFIAEGLGWFGVCLAIGLTVYGCVLIRKTERLSSHPRMSLLIGAVAALVLITASYHQPRVNGRAVEDLVAFNTNFGAPPKTDEEVTSRYERIAAMASSIAEGEGAARLVVFPETSIGQFDPSFSPILRNEIEFQARKAGQTFILGAEIAGNGGSMQNLALIVRKDGTMSYVAQRQPALLSMWAPWRDRHFPADWLANNILPVENDLKFSVMFCFEEYIPFLYLINEARDRYSMIVVLANAWAAPTLETTIVQATHTEGMARLFGRRYLRAENYRPEMARESRALQARQQMVAK